MNWLERDAASGWHPFTQHGLPAADRRTVITRNGRSWLYDVDGGRALDGSPAPVATKDPALPPPDPDQPGGPAPTDPEGPTDPKPTDPTDPTGPDEPPAVGRVRAAFDGVAG
jgi:hypothetical protein